MITFGSAIAKVQDLFDAAEAFVTQWDDSWLADELGTKLTCDEVEAVAGMLTACGRPEAAKSWIDSHAEGDECGDTHCMCEDCAGEGAVTTP